MEKVILLGLILFGSLCLIFPVKFTTVGATTDYTNYNQVKIFQSCNAHSGAEVEEQINNFLKGKRIHPSQIVDIALSTSSTSTSRISYTCTTAMIVYQE